MKTTLFAAVALALGIVVGFGATWAQFASERDFFEFDVERDFDILAKFARDEAGKTEAEIEAMRGSPQVVIVGDETHDFGTMELYSTKSHTFVFKNAGSTPLSMTLIETTCKCTTSDVVKDKPFTIAPGEEKGVTLEWKAEEYAPVFSQSANFETNDVNRRFLRVAIRGRIIQTMRAVPSDLALTNISSNTSKTAIVRLFAFKDDKIECRRFELKNPTTADYFDVQVEPLTDDEVALEAHAKSGLLIHVTIKPGLPIGSINQTLVLHTNIQQDGGLEIPITGSVVGDISVVGFEGFDSSKNILTLGLVKKGQGEKARLHLIVRGPHRDEVELSVDQEQVDPADVLMVQIGKPVDIGQAKTARMFPLAIEIPPNSRAVNCMGKKREDVGKIIIRSTHPTTKSIEVFVRFAVEG